MRNIHEEFAHGVRSIFLVRFDITTFVVESQSINVMVRISMEGFNVEGFHSHCATIQFKSINICGLFAEPCSDECKILDGN